MCSMFYGRRRYLVQHFTINTHLPLSGRGDTLWCRLHDPLVECRKAGEARRAEHEEECDTTYVEYMFWAKNRETM